MAYSSQVRIEEEQQVTNEPSDSSDMSLDERVGVSVTSKIKAKQIFISLQYSSTV